MGVHAEGGYIAVNRNGFQRLEFRNGEPVLTAIVNPELDKPGNRFNDGKADPFGGFWAGTMDDAEKDSAAGSWWRLDRAGKATCLDTGFHVTNGPAFDPRRKRVYFTDSAKQRVYSAIFAENGKLSDKSVYAQFGEGQGYPDGMMVDAEGFLWIAFWDGACIRRLDPDGRIEQEISLPVLRPTSMVIVKDKMYFTSASVGLSAEQRRQWPLSGSLFSIKMGQALEPETYFYKGSLRD